MWVSKARNRSHVSVVAATMARQMWHWTLAPIRLKEGKGRTTEEHANTENKAVNGQRHL